jgi:hypothetical protein
MYIRRSVAVEVAVVMLELHEIIKAGPGARTARAYSLPFWLLYSWIKGPTLKVLL